MLKKIYDPVHGFIRFNRVEKDLIDARPFQRLHDIRQLGMAYQVYPGAVHTRYEHSLGVMELATRIFDQILFKDATVCPDPSYWKQIVRLAALCHDLGHLPFSHAAEKELLGEEGHEKWTYALIKSPYLMPIWESLQADFPDKEIVRDLSKIAVGEKKLKLFAQEVFSPWERMLSQVITGDFFGADRIDYLLRDAQCTGVSYGLFDYHQLIETLCLLSFEGKWELGVEESGIESCEALLLARYFMYKRVYQHRCVKAYSFHLSRFMKRCFAPIEDIVSLSDAHVFVEITKAAADASHPGHKDALSLTVRSKRFRAFVLPAHIREKDLLAIQKEKGIEEDKIGWEFSEEPKEKIGLSFPILRKNHTVENAATISDLLIPSKSINFVYIDPKWAHSMDCL